MKLKKIIESQEYKFPIQYKNILKTFLKNYKEVYDSIPDASVTHNQPALINIRMMKLAEECESVLKLIEKYY